jgi:ATP-dependent helicase/nuclease subunit B
MVVIAHVALEPAVSDPWPPIVAQARAWAAEHGVALRDAIVLLPFAQHLPLARRAWASAGGWLPRIETTLTLARGLAPPQAVDASQVSFDTALDRLAARRLMRGQAWGQAWQRRDARGFDHAVNALVQTAHDLLRAASAIPPERRADHWDAARALLAPAAGPGATERLLARVALEWAAAGGPVVTDVLFGVQPSAWISVQAGGDDALTAALLSQDSSRPCLRIVTDAAPQAPFDEAARNAGVAVAVCADFESEAQRAAAEVIANLNRGQRPVALIAQDRLLMRRVRALLARQQVPLLDETGWKLSTTRAGALVMSLLRAASPRAVTDDWLDWLKACAHGWPQQPGAAWALQIIESKTRRAGWVGPSAVDAAQLPGAAAALWRSAQQLVAEFASPRTRSFRSWLLALRSALEACGAWVQLSDDAAGRQALTALHLLDAVSWPAERDAGADAMPLDEFAAWVDAALEDASFIPESPQDAAVVITPLARASLRPFAAVVMPGADENHLGATPSPHSLLSETLAAELGLPTSARRRDDETLAFAQLLRLPRITLLRRLDNGGEPLAPSPLLVRLCLAMRQAGRGDLPAAADPLAQVAVATLPVRRPQPAAAALLPARLSASACEALRACPYRFFALRLLSLREAEELDDAVEKRDYGTWLHAVLHRFHLARPEPAPAAEEEARLQATALQVQQEMRLDDAAFLPFAATFARFAPRYVQWLHERDAQGAQWLDGERELSALPPQWGGVEMYGVIDRVDSVPGEEGPLTQLIDYKTGSAQALRSLVRRSQEDTQLVFYAALMAGQSQAGGAISAIYLPLDEAQGIKPIEHPDVESTARLLVDGIGRDLARLRNGAAMPALGEGTACDFCEARGLCRRDHWSPEQGA